MEIQKEIVKKIKILMIEKNVKNSQISKILNLKRDAWIKRLNLVTKLKIEEIKKIAEFLQVSIEELL